MSVWQILESNYKEQTEGIIIQVQLMTKKFFKAFLRMTNSFTSVVTSLTGGRRNLGIKIN